MESISDEQLTSYYMKWCIFEFVISLITASCIRTLFTVRPVHPSNLHASRLGRRVLFRSIVCCVQQSGFSPFCPNHKVEHSCLASGRLFNQRSRNYQQELKRCVSKHLIYNFVVERLTARAMVFVFSVALVLWQALVWPPLPCRSRCLRCTSIFNYTLDPLSSIDFEPGCFVACFFSSRAAMLWRSIGQTSAHVLERRPITRRSRSLHR